MQGWCVDARTIRSHPLQRAEVGCSTVFGRYHGGSSGRAGFLGGVRGDGFCAGWGKGP